MTGYPPLLRQHPLKKTYIEQYHSLPSILKEKGYTTTFFTNADEQYDNLGVFLNINGLDKTYSQKDYPSNEIVGTWGAPDHFVFNFSIPIIQQLANQTKPFFVTILTNSNHPPLYLPTNIDFIPKAQTIENQMIEYADWSISLFMEKAKKRTLV
ncbi:MAG: hypothetical protein RLZZ292_2029 [Bacteroidota bacterium]|jgi:phosphoglycerol transferase MdoB-like AlkP superfamily enzyme